MLTFEQKLAVVESFPELQRKDVSLGRVNFQYEDSAYDRKNVVYHLHKNGNGFVYAGHLKGYATDEKGLVNIRDFSEEELRGLLTASIRSLSPSTPQNAKRSSSEPAEGGEELWIGPENHTLRLYYEDELWYLYDRHNLESAFETYEEAEEYLREEGFARSGS
ncbi:hypothetical protein N0M98_00765 [Paenibacillus doosanensis]|uniref:Uncharacterized protein n=1 Tax=Paenibacillus konkukensis TaxID=2020716 RepID=A0ABY4RXE7_9BACL|nr:MULTISPECIES: hypothetical protein [Paenibacillus]MCS7458654.1 hypothetical protein [Paenibacillus doosanensis]UQZ86822.1 hypothetical protein SK3146_06115 [Paenibacillus konkukensis]